jgi:hypothetical protein
MSEVAIARYLFVEQDHELTLKASRAFALAVLVHIARLRGWHSKDITRIMSRCASLISNTATFDTLPFM